jgi:hypothetical protein
MVTLAAVEAVQQTFVLVVHLFHAEKSLQVVVVVQEDHQQLIEIYTFHMEDQEVD